MPRAALSGLTPDNIGALRNVAAKALVPDKVAARAETAEALRLLTKGAAMFTKDVGDLIISTGIDMILE